jgi:hypothetical protein
MPRFPFLFSLTCLLGLLLGSPASAAFSVCELFMLSWAESPKAALTYYRQHKFLRQRTEEMYLLLDRLGITVSPSPDEAFHTSRANGGVLYRSVRENLVEVRAVSPDPVSQANETSFLAHPTIPTRLAALHAMDGRLMLNPSLYGSGGASAELGNGRLFLSPDASHRTFEHEFAHLVFELSLNGKLDPDIRAQFAPVFDFIDYLRAKAKFRNSTLHEIFAGLHERRIAADSYEISPPTSADSYMLSYVWFELNSLPAYSLTPTEKEWKQLAQESRLRPAEKNSP